MTKKNLKKNGASIFNRARELVKCFIFLNSGGVTSKTFSIPMNYFFLKMLNIVDKILIKIFPNIFCMGRKLY